LGIDTAHRPPENEIKRWLSEGPKNQEENATHDAVASKKAIKRCLREELEGGEETK